MHRFDAMRSIGLISALLISALINVGIWLVGQAFGFHVSLVGSLALTILLTIVVNVVLGVVSRRRRAE